MDIAALRLPRRKLVDNVMKTFLVGNTSARPLLTPLEGELLNNERANDVTGENEDTEGGVSSVTGKRKHEDGGGFPPLDLLFLGVGDLRNPLMTLTSIPSQRPVCFYLNDLSPVTVARNAVLAHLSKTSAKAEIIAAVWYDALISSAAVEALKGSIQALLAEVPEWLQPFDTDTESVLTKHWSAWLEVLSNYNSHAPLLLLARNDAMSGEGVGHGRAGVSSLWKRTGISSAFVTVEASKRLVFNPTLFDCDLDRSRFVFLDTQGPGGAYKELDKLVCGTQAFADALMQVVRPLIASLKSRESVVMKVQCGDCMSFVRKIKGSQRFHAVDTSNLMDYLGLFNLLIELRSLLVETRSSFLVTEMVLSGASTLDDMIMVLFPNETDWAHLLFAYLGFTVKQIKNSLQEEKVVRCSWHIIPQCSMEKHVTKYQGNLEQKLDERKDRLRTLIGRQLSTDEEREDLVALSLSELELLFTLCESLGSGMDAAEELTAVLRETLEKKTIRGASSLDSNTEVLRKCLNSVALDFLCPEPFTKEMTESPQVPIDRSFRWPTHTVLSFMTLFEQIRTLSPLGNANLEGYWEAFDSDDGLSKCPGIRNRKLAIKTMRHLVGVNDKPSLDRVLSEGQVQMFTFTIEPEMDLTKSRAGVFEPALAVILINDEITLNKLHSLNWNYVGDANSLFQHIYYKCTSRKVQIFDNVAFDVKTNQLTLPLPHRTKIPYTYLALMDIQRYAIVSKPIDLSTYTANP